MMGPGPGMPGPGGPPRTVIANYRSAHSGHCPRDCIMPRCRPAAVRRGDARPAAIFIILGFGLFAMVGLILAVAMLPSACAKSAVTNPSAPSAPRPLEARYSGLLCYSPPEPESVMAVDVTALNADPTGRNRGGPCQRDWQRARETQFAKVPLSARRRGSYIVAAGLGSPDDGARLRPQRSTRSSHRNSVQPASRRGRDPPRASPRGRSRPRGGSRRAGSSTTSCSKCQGRARAA